MSTLTEERVPSPNSASSRPWGPALVAATIALAPILVVALLRLPVINQRDWADAWFYSAYGWVPKHHYAYFGLNYFAVRFPATISIGAFENAFGAQAGYLLLRYLLAVASGWALYLLVRRFATRGVALAAVVLLLLNPFFSRELLWDYSYFSAVAGGVVGIALWWWSEERALAWSVAAGVVFSIAVFSHTTLLTLLFVLGVIELVAAARTGRGAVVRLLQRAGLALVGAAALFLAGWLVYRQLLGGLSPYDMLRPTVDFVRNNDKEVAPYVLSPKLWLWHEPRIWAPVVLSVALLLVLGRRVLGTDLVARIAQLCIAFTAFVWAYRFAATSSFIEAWWSYNITVIVMAPAVAVLLHVLVTERGLTPRLPAIAVAVSAVAALLIRNLPGPAGDLYRPLAEHSAQTIALLVVTLALAAALLVRRRAIATIALAAFLAAGVVMTYAIDVLDGRGDTGVFVTDGGADWDAYAGGHRFAEYVRDHEHLGSRMLLWYPWGSGPQSIAWVDLPHLGQTVNELGADQPLDAVAPLGRARLEQPQVSEVLVMSPRPGDIPAAERALRAGGFRFTVADRGEFIARRLPFALLRITKKP